MGEVRELKDKLFLLKPGFLDPSYPDRRFYCWHCALIEGVLALFPDLAKLLEVERVDWQRPRASVVAVVGEKNQSLPLLVLGDGSFINDKDRILEALAQRHGFPEPHP